MTRREIFRLIRVRGRHEWENPPVSLGRIAVLGCEREGFVRTLSALLFCLVAAVSVAHADVKHVANFGVDSPACGLQETPCRSISQAIRNASEGDTVFVGPGLYGDLNHNGVVGELGEEGASIPSGESCLVCVSKRLTLLSQRGAAHTTIDARNLPLTAVTLSRIIPAPQSASMFGYLEQGFTVLAGDREGISMPDGGRVWGNRIIGGTTGIHAAYQFQTTRPEIYDNEVTEAASRGIAVYSGRVSGNVVARNGAGISAFRSMDIENNTIADNRGDGVSIGDPYWPHVRIIHNLFIRNAGPGVLLNDGDPNYFDFSTGELWNDVAVFGNDFIGNDPQRHCGIENHVSTIWATNNFWGGAPDFGVTQQIVCGRAHIEPSRTQPH